MYNSLPGVVVVVHISSMEVLMTNYTDLQLTNIICCPYISCCYYYYYSYYYYYNQGIFQNTAGAVAQAALAAVPSLQSNLSQNTARVGQAGLQQSQFNSQTEFPPCDPLALKQTG